MPKIKTSSGITMYYEQHGQGPDLVLVSGFSSDHNAWIMPLDTLSKKFRVTVFDNRGVGQTDAPQGPYTIAMMAQDTIALMDALSIQSAHVIGHSMGGMILQQICLHYPDRVKKAILNASAAVSPSHASAQIMSFVKQREANVPDEVIIETILPWLYSDTFFNDPEGVAKTIAIIMANPYPQTLEGLKAQAHACLEKELPPKISGIKTPTLVIAGQEDVLFPLHCSEYLHQKIAGSQLAVLSQSGHITQVEQTDLFCKAVVDFLGHA
ncbi:MAG: hypothetical protein COV45_08210 [Deltaproteobacteria bacterium CG11_big_fil_rev_8_21_14_0_20_47_16]|nr:MAG: hypothetical protein COV45_08210 [Deltaproteobacteria bacterium CG11_big_fil_rev_8_21_14_0_20_47_16]